MADDGDRYVRGATVITEERVQPVFVGLETPQLDVGYLRTLSGLVKCIAIVSDLD